jgi:hypothetical protein
LADDEIDREFTVIVADQRFRNAQKAYEEIRDPGTRPNERTRALEDEARRLKGDIEYTGWVRLERKKKLVSKRIEQLRNGRLRI